MPQSSPCAQHDQSSPELHASARYVVYVQETVRKHAQCMQNARDRRHGATEKKQDRSLNYKWIARSVFKKSIPLEIVDARRAFRSPHNLLPKCPECGSSRFQKELQERDTAGCRLKHGDTYHLRRIRLCRNQLTAQRYFLAHIPDCCMKKSYSYFSK